MTSKMIRRGMATVALLILVGCGSADEAQPPMPPGSSDASEFNDSDVMFAQMMIPHHEQALELSDIALDPRAGASDAVKALATQIKEAQDPEIELMTSLLTAWGQPTAMDPSMDHSSMMSGMLSVNELDALSQTQGAELDRQWLEAMIAHHEGAIVMAEDLLQSGVNSELRSLGEQIITSQQAEIDEMRSLLG